MTYIPLTVINAAIGSEADGFTKVTEIADDIFFDKTVLANTLNSFGIPSSPSESLIVLINKVSTLVINFIIIAPPEFFGTPVTPSIVDTFTTFQASLLPSSENETFGNPNPSFTDNGNIYTGGDAVDTTHSIDFFVTDVTDGSHLAISSTSGMSNGDTIVQGINTTTIVTVIDINNLQVIDTTGWVAETLVTSF